MTQPFRDRAWGDRFNDMGDQAEQAFEAYADRTRRGWYRLGLDRPPIRVYELPTRLRCLPDYLTTKSFVECMGCGRDQTVKVKLDKHGAMHWWNDLHPVEFFFWDSTNQRHVLIPLLEFDRLLPSSTMGTFDGTKPYFAVPFDLLCGWEAARSTQEQAA